MTSPHEYRRRITELGLDSWSMDVSSVGEAKDALATTKKLKDSVWEIKREVKQDVSVVWAEYRKASQGSFGQSIGSGLVAGFLGKRTANLIRAQKREQLRNERDRLLNSYSEIHSITDNLLKQLDSNKAQLYEFIRDLKTKKQVQKRKSQVFSRQNSKKLRFQDNKKRFFRNSRGTPIYGDEVEWTFLQME